MLKLPGGFGGSGKRYIVGFDLTDTSCGISYCSDQGEIRTISLVAGSEEYVIPMALSKRHGAGQWFFGKDAFASADAGESVLVGNLFSKALWGEDTHIDGLVYGAGSLFTLYLKRAFGLHGTYQGVAQEPAYQDRQNILHVAFGELLSLCRKSGR